ncbi:hypothetical protein QFC22_005812 [Naganishia vaughanmartiniae]|uniref:Uncharacterized protein n=1 Tax=Naganishia vaughanmartiniae TaxID=1424756 RepID=A0ACC2WQD5_9TREE|nr:hypothetical protein QFC22_005812 [Naganishia vaughanmartiniae]
MSSFALTASRTARQTGFKSLRAVAPSARLLCSSGKSPLTARSTIPLSLGAQRYLQTYNGAANVNVPPSSLDSVPSPAEGKGHVSSAVNGKLYPSADEAIKDLRGGITVLSAGFGLCGTAETVITAMAKRQDLQDLTVVSNNAGNAGDDGLSPLVKSRQIKKCILSYLGQNKALQDAYLGGEIALELNPQGSLADRLRAAGAGQPGFYTRTGAGTFIETGGIPQLLSKKDGNKEQTVLIPGNKKQVAEYDGKKYLFEPAIHGDVAILRAWKVDKAGNCVFRYTTRAFGTLMAKAAKIAIVEAENIVEVGEIAPMDIDLPGIYIDRIVPATVNKKIEVVVLRDEKKDSSQTPNKAEAPKTPARLRREKIARRAAKELKNGMYCNLGVGMPVLAASFLPPGTEIWLQSENGILGMGPYPTQDQVDADIINAGKETVTLLPGASVFDSSESFGMIRGGHVDVSILGAMEVASNGDLANYMIPGKLVKGMGGAMDLCSNPDKTKIVVVTDHLDKHGNSKVVAECSLPKTAVGCVSRIITDLAVFDIDREHGVMTLVELAKGVELEHVQKVTAAPFKVAENIGVFA